MTTSSSSRQPSQTPLSLSSYPIPVAIVKLFLIWTCAPTVCPAPTGLGTVFTFNSSRRQTVTISNQMLPKSEGERLGLLLVWRIHATHILCLPVCLHNYASVSLSVGFVCLSLGLLVCVCTSQPTPIPGFSLIQGTIGLSFQFPTTPAMLCPLHTPSSSSRTVSRLRVSHKTKGVFPPPKQAQALTAGGPPFRPSPALTIQTPKKQ